MGKLSLTLLTCLLILSPTVVMGEKVTSDDLVFREDLFYKKFSDVPFTGTVTGGKKGQGKLKKGKRVGTWLFYYDNGQLRLKINKKDGVQHGPFFSYHRNGRLWAKGTYKNGKLEGPWVSYDDRGRVNKKSTGTYKNGKKIFD